MLARMQARAHAYTQTYMYTYTHTHTHTHTHTYAQAPALTSILTMQSLIYTTQTVQQTLGADGELHGTAKMAGL